MRTADFWLGVWGNLLASFLSWLIALLFWKWLKQVRDRHGSVVRALTVAAHTVGMLGLVLLVTFFDHLPVVLIVLATIFILASLAVALMLLLDSPPQAKTSLILGGTLAFVVALTLIIGYGHRNLPDVNGSVEIIENPAGVSAKDPRAFDVFYRADVNRKDSPTTVPARGR